MRDHPSGRPVRERIVKAQPERPGRRTFPIVERLSAPPVNELAGGIGFVILRDEPDEDATVMHGKSKHRETNH